MKSVLSVSVAVLLAATLVGFIGCGPSNSGDAAIAAVNKNNVQRVANLYARFYVAKAGEKFVGPEDEKTFKEFVSNMDEKALSRMGVDPTDIDGLFTGRDGKPLKIRYGVKGDSRGGSQAVAFEEEGVDGVRMVGFTGLKVIEVDNDAEYDELWAGKKDSGGTGGR